MALKKEGGSVTFTYRARSGTIEKYYPNIKKGSYSFSSIQKGPV
jgi:hypothetical protein